MGEFTAAVFERATQLRQASQAASEAGDQDLAEALNDQLTYVERVALEHGVDVTGPIPVITDEEPGGRLSA